MVNCASLPGGALGSAGTVWRADWSAHRPGSAGRCRDGGGTL